MGKAFRLQRVLDVRRAQALVAERDLADAIAAAVAQAEQVTVALAAEGAVLAGSRAALAGDVINIATLRDLHSDGVLAREATERARSRQARLEEKADAAEGAAIRARQAHLGLVRLQERHERRAKAADLATEQRELDEVVMQMMHRRRRDKRRERARANATS